MGTALGLIAVAVLLLLCGVFVAAEFALVAVDPLRLDKEAEQGSRRARIGRGLLRHLSFHLAGAQLGITVTSLIIGVLARPAIAVVIEPAIEPIVGETAVQAVALAAAFVIATVVQMVASELFPKGLAIARPEATTRALAPALSLYGKLFGPFIRMLDGGANRVVRAMGIEPSEELSQVRSLPELELLISDAAAEGVLDGPASTLLNRSIRFGRKTAADALVPRVSLSALSTEDSVSVLVDRSLETGFSRFPVYGRDLDDVVGVAHVKVAHSVPRAARATTRVADVMDEIHAVPESRELEDVMVDMKRLHRHLMIVTDEYGGTAGIITLEDLLEEIVGEIDDEHDPAVPPPVARPLAGELRISGGLHPDEVEEMVGVRVPDGGYETIAGFMLDRLGHIPVVGETVEFEDWTFEVAAMERRRITHVVIRGGLSRDGFPEDGFPEDGLSRGADPR